MRLARSPACSPLNPPLARSTRKRTVRCSSDRRISGTKHVGRFNCRFGSLLPHVRAATSVGLLTVLVIPLYVDTAVMLYGMIRVRRERVEASETEAEVRTFQLPQNN